MSFSFEIWQRQLNFEREQFSEDQDVDENAVLGRKCPTSNKMMSMAGSRPRRTIRIVSPNCLSLHQNIEKMSALVCYDANTFLNIWNYVF